MNNKKLSNQKRVHCVSLGCARNLVDSEIMLGFLQKEGFCSTPIAENADCIIVNTCGFLAKSRTESLETISSVCARKKKGAKVIVTGCLAQLKGDFLDPIKNQVHYIIGSGQLASIVEAVTSTTAGTAIGTEGSFLEEPSTPRLLSTPPHYAYVKIAEGCKKRCSYCIIPQIKGYLKSKPIENIIEEVKSLVEKGVFEIILIAQDLGDYGKDLGYKGSTGLITLLNHLSAINHDFRVRLLYVYPDEITEEFIDCIQKNKKILPYLDMPIQHINDTVLTSMHRTTTSSHIRSTVNLLRKAIPHITLRTSIIVGFPGETEQQFDDLCSLVKEKLFDTIGFFTYSNEPLSASFSLPNQVPEEIKQQRVAHLGSIQQKNVEQAHKLLIGTKIPVLIDGFHPETNLLLIGRRVSSCPEIDPVVLINNFTEVTHIGVPYLVEITETSEYDLIGTVKKPCNKAKWS